MVKSPQTIRVWGLDFIWLTKIKLFYLFDKL